jgi:hypothetical protein
MNLVCRICGFPQSTARVECSRVQVLESHHGEAVIGLILCPADADRNTMILDLRIGGWP